MSTLVVGVADCRVSAAPRDTIATFGLGSCIALAVWDPQARVGGLLHFMLPDSAAAGQIRPNAYMYADTGIPKLLDEICALGGSCARLEACAAGAASMSDAPAGFDIGKRNYQALRRLLSHAGLSLRAEAVGGNQSRSLRLQIGAGEFWVQECGQERKLLEASARVNGRVCEFLKTGGPHMSRRRKIRVLIVDDSAIVRRLLANAIEASDDLEVAGTAPDPYVARDKILALKPDVLTLDIEMPRMDGLTFLRKLMQFHPLPAVVISSVAQSNCRAALEAMQWGAVEVLAKPGGPYSVGELRMTLASKIRAAAQFKWRTPLDPAHLPEGSCVAAPAPAADNVIAIGASTGGTEAIAAIARCLPAHSPPILITQHIPPVFSRAFAERLDANSALEVREAADGDRLRPGLALVAPGDRHMLLRGEPGHHYVEVSAGPRVCYQRPSVDVLFLSVAAAAGARAIGVLLTGMGSDGARGLLEMRQAGARTIAQDEATSAIFGMPREAIELGAAADVLPLHDIARHLGAASPNLAPAIAPRAAPMSYCQ